MSQITNRMGHKQMEKQKINDSRNNFNKCSAVFFVEKSSESFFTGFDLLVLFEVRREWCENVRETYGEILCNF